MLRNNIREMRSKKRRMSEVKVMEGFERNDDDLCWLCLTHFSFSLILPVHPSLSSSSPMFLFFPSIYLLFRFQSASLPSPFNKLVSAFCCCRHKPDKTATMPAGKSCCCRRKAAPPAPFFETDHHFSRQSSRQMAVIQSFFLYYLGRLAVEFCPISIGGSSHKLACEPGAVLRSFCYLFRFSLFTLFYSHANKTEAGSFHTPAPAAFSAPDQQTAEGRNKRRKKTWRMKRMEIGIGEEAQLPHRAHNSKFISTGQSTNKFSSAVLNRAVDERRREAKCERRERRRGGSRRTMVGGRETLASTTATIIGSGGEW
jgi:hypothetical protein